MPLMIVSLSVTSRRMVPLPEPVLTVTVYVVPLPVTPLTLAPLMPPVVVEAEVAAVDAGHALAEGDGVVDAGGVRRIGAGPDDRGDGGGRAGGLRGEVEVVDREAVVAAGHVDVGPADPERRTVRDRQRRDGRNEVGAVPRRVAVLGADRRRVGGHEVERRDVGPRAGHEVGGVRAVFEVDLVGTPRGAEAPFLAEVIHVEAGDRAAGVVREAGAEVRDERAAAQSAEGAIRSRRGTIAVGVSGGAGTRIDGVLLVVARAAPGLGHEPAGDGQVVRRDPAVFDRVSKFCVEALPRVVRLTHCP